MKTSSRKNCREQGSALLVSIVIGTLMLLSLASYLTLVDHQTHMSNRSQAWNTSIALCEAGIEEALEHINANYEHLATEGWGYDGTYYVMDYDMGDGSGYSVSIDPTTDPFTPKIVSRGVIMVQGGPVTPIFGAFGMRAGEDFPVARAIKVHVTRGSLFIKAMVAKHSIQMNGNNVRTDSYDSGNPLKSTNGKYDPAKAGDLGDVAVNSSILNGINVGNANIYGHAATGPNGTVAVGPNGGVGERSWQATHPGGMQPGWVTDDMNFTFPEPTLPYQVGLNPLPGQVVTAEPVVTATPQTNAPPSGVDAGTNFTSYNYVTNYPGNVLGLTTNLVWETSTDVPGAGLFIGSIVTNNILRREPIWPGASVGPITTNTTTVTSITYPSIQGKTITTNYTTVSDSQLPSPLPSGPIVTNTTVGKSKQYPPTGTFVGTPRREPPWWIFNLIVGYSWSVPRYSWTEVDYSWSAPSYTYQRAVYGVPNYSYTWTQYTTNYIYTTNYYDHVLDSGNYIISTLSGKTYVGGDAQLVVLDDIRMSGNDFIEIGPSGKLHAYVDGNSSAVSGNGVINKSGLAANCIIEFTQNVTDISFNGNGEFIGVLVAPDAALRLNGGGNSVTDFCGAVIANTIVLNGHFKFHYDEALGRLGGNGRFLITYWDEVDPDQAFSSP